MTKLERRYKEYILQNKRNFVPFRDRILVLI